MQTLRTLFVIIIMLQITLSVSTGPLPLYNKYNAPINFALTPTPYSALLNKCATPHEPDDDFSNIQSQIKQPIQYEENYMTRNRIFDFYSNTECCIISLFSFGSGQPELLPSELLSVLFAQLPDIAFYEPTCSPGRSLHFWEIRGSRR